MKGKVISLIVSAAVVLGLLLVPAAMPAALAAGGIGIEVVPQLTQKGFSETFEVEIWTNDTPGDDYNAVGVRLIYETKYVTCNAVIDSGIWDYTATCECNNSWDPGNGTGLVKFDASLLGAGNVFNTSQKACTVNFTTTSNTSNSGISGLDFIFIVADDATSVVHPTSGDVLDWDEVVNGTLKVGSPALTVDVVPDGKGTVKANSVLLTGDPNTTNWAWDQVVNLEAIESTAGWEFDNWTGTDNDAINPTTVTMDVAKNVTANFVEKPCELGVNPNSLALDARQGSEEDSDTVTISNEGGGTLCWALGTPPSWSVNDTWTYNNIYQPFNCIVGGSNFSVLNVTVTGGGAGSDYNMFVDITPPAERTIEGGAPAILWNATGVVDECSLDWLQQVARMTIWVPNMTPVTGTMTWAYDDCHGWPYWLSKTWYYNLTVDVKTWPVPYPVVHKVESCMAIVTNQSQVYGPYTDCWEITHIETTNMTPFLVELWSPTVRNVVYRQDGGTFDYPPADIRMLTGAVIAGLGPPAGCTPPSWLSFDKAGGSLGISGSELLTVTANSTGLSVGTYNGSFCVSGCCASYDYEVVDVVFEVKPATTLDDVVRDLPDDALLADAEYPGDSFYVYVNFSAPTDDFNSIGVTDYAPAGWLVQTDNTWCVPVASWNKSNYNKAEYAWAGGGGDYVAGTTFSAKYLVTIPATATAGSNFWPNCSPMPCPPCDGSPLNNYPAWVEYWFGPAGPYETVICEEREKVVTVPGCVVGETRDVNANLLDSVTVVLYEQPMVLEDSDSSSLVPISTIPAPEHASVEGGTFYEDPTTWYENCADDTGYYWQNASKYCYYSINSSDMPSPRNYSHPDLIDWSTPELLAAGYRMDFEADYGLVCKAASMSYAMTSVNHWLFVPIDGSLTPHPEWQIHSWKADESIHSWQFPCGCNC